MRLALVHDWLKEIGGAERVLIELHKIFPEAPIYVLFFDKKFTDQWLPGAKIHPSFLQKIPFITKIYPLFAWLMPAAIESLDLSEYERVLSSSVTFSKGLVVKPSTKHICYCYSPTRFAWDWHAEYARHKSWPAKIFQHLIRLWDYAASARVDQFIAISKHVQARIKKYYRVDSEVIYPPVRDLLHRSPDKNSTEFFPLPRLPASGRSLKEQISSGFYLIVARLYPHKNIDKAIQAFNKLGYPLVIVGDGPMRKKLEKMAGKNIRFTGEIADEELASYYANCKALVMPQEEDFGLTPLEAAQFGKPTVALRRGGAIETIIEGVTGEFFDDSIPEAIAHAIRKLEEHYAGYNPMAIKEQAQLFSIDQFKEKIILAIQ